MKPFNLEQALAGKPVITRDGRKARVICANIEGTIFPVVAAIKDDNGCEHVGTYTLSGTLFDPATTDIESDSDLFMDPEKRKGWINLYNLPRGVDTVIAAAGDVHTTEQQAKDMAKGASTYITTIMIEWEE